MVFPLVNCCAKEKAKHRTFTAAAPPNIDWRDARVDVEFSPGNPFGFKGSATGDAIKHTLNLTNARQEQTEISLVFAMRDHYPDSPSREWFRALSDASYQISFAPDGHALTLSMDKGSTWRYVGLDAPTPLSCPHHRLSGTARGPDWTNAPSTRGLALEILHSWQGPAEKSHLSRVNQRECSEYSAELEQVTHLACSSAGDDELRRSLIEFWVFPQSNIPCRQGPTKQEPRISLAARSLAGSPELIERLVARLAAPPADWPVDGRLFAAQLLSTLNEPSVQDALASYLGKPSPLLENKIDRRRDECWIRTEMARALASISVARSKASPLAESVLILLAEEHHGCHPSTEEYLNEHAMQQFAIRALFSLGTKKARQSLERIAAAACNAPAIEWLTAIEWLSENKDRDLKESAMSPNGACWAKAALARSPSMPPSKER